LGRHPKLIDSALSGKHVRSLFDTLTRTEAQILAQLRTITPNSRATSANVAKKKEDTSHFLLHCQRYQHLCKDMINEGKERYGDLSYILGGRWSHVNSDGLSPDGPIEKWKPNVTMVRIVIKYAVKNRETGLPTGLLTHAQTPSSLRFEEHA
ncbi:hypothetical protein K432DRAFT_284840, partial [Lepidopterella palustris CBS 459.81]